MVAQELGLHEQSNDDHKFQDPYKEEEEEEVDTLSFCDLPLTSTSCSSWDEYQNSSFGDEGFFEFSSQEDLTASTYPPAAADKIIFCGKVIGSKAADEDKEEETKLMDKKAQNQESNNAKIKGGSFHEVVRTTSSKRHQVRSSSGHKTLSSQGSLKEVSVVSSPLMKSKWYVFEFGMGRYSMEMEQRDIKMRQSRRVPTTMFPMAEKDEEGNGRRSGKGLWALLRLLGGKKKPKTQR